MNRLLVSLSAATVLAASAAAQCINVSSPGTALTIATGDLDDGIYGLQPLGFTYTMPGSAGIAGGYTHCFVGTNGWIFLTDSLGNTTGRPAGGDYGSTAATAAGIRGAAGNHPLLCPYWGDLENDAAGAGVFIDNTTNPGVSCKITWVNANDWQSGTPLPSNLKNFSAEIFLNGDIVYSYGAISNPGGTKYVAVSARNGVALPTAGNFVPGPAAAPAGLIYQSFGTNTIDTGNSSLTFVQDGLGGWTESVTCQVLAASNTNSGKGCYNISDSFYQFFAGPAAAAAGLNGQSMKLTPNGNAFDVTWGGGVYVTPTGAATDLLLGDDDEANVTPTVAFPYQGGSVGTMSVCSNGYVNMGPIGGNSTTSYANVTNLLNDTVGAFRSNIDYDPGTAGVVKSEEVVLGQMLHVTYENCERYNAGVSTGNVDRVQFQMNLLNGEVTIVWDAVQGITGAGSSANALVGYSPGGASQVNPTFLAVEAPFTTGLINGGLAMSLSAAPAPVSTVSTGTTVTYTTIDIPETFSGSGTYSHGTFVSFTPLPGGVHLPSIGVAAPQCFLYIAWFDIALAVGPNAATQTGTLTIPPGIPYGLPLYAQSIAFVVPGSLPNGQNLFGAVTSNLVTQFISIF